MALGIMIAGLLAATFGALIALVMGLDLSSTLMIYGIFGVCGGIFACLVIIPMRHDLGRHHTPHNRTMS